jgi:transcriptional regulator with XRE-family HTH domain
MNEQDVLKKARRLVKKTGLTYQQVGERMGYPPESARQSAWRFLNVTNPSVAMLLKFAKAMNIDVKELL